LLYFALGVVGFDCEGLSGLLKMEEVRGYDIVGVEAVDASESTVESSGEFMGLAIVLLAVAVDVMV
jgi:hypothetical protein